MKSLEMRKSLINRKELDKRFIDNAISERADTETIKEDYINTLNTQNGLS